MEISQFNKSLMPDLSKKLDRRRKFAMIFISAFLVLLSILSLVFLRSLLNAPSLYKGVCIQGQDVGGFTREELTSYLEEYYANVFDDITLTFFSPQFERHVTISELGIGLDIGAMAQKAYELGRSGNLLQRLSQIAKLVRNPVSIGLVFDFDSTAFNSFLDKTYESVFQEIIPTNIVILEDSVILCTGIFGQEADRERLKADIVRAVESLDSAQISIPIIQKAPPIIDMETTLATLNQDPVNAEFVKTSRTTYEIKPHQMGRRIEREKLMEVLTYVENRESKEYEEILLPVEFIAPALTEGALREMLFRDTLASYTTQFNTETTNNKNRAINIGLAAKSIDGTLLLPGEEFSFNKIVGPRTPDKGYQIAHIFIEGEIRDGTGGGICQVSTTLYNAVLKANLPVSERHNHMFTVGYVPLGLDAAVSYGYADLVFKNTNAYPLRISAVVSENNTVSFKISSTNDYPNLIVKTATKTISTTPVTVQYVDDATLPQGTLVVTENGMDGYVVDTYIKVFNGDTLIREEKLHRSVYQMLPRKIKRGTASVFEMIE